MKERTFVAGLVTFLLVGSLIAAKSTDATYIAATIGFFAICVAYAEWCERL
jgi:hypothetical protein